MKLFFVSYFFYIPLNFFQFSGYAQGIFLFAYFKRNFMLTFIALSLKNKIFIQLKPCLATATHNFKWKLVTFSTAADTKKEPYLRSYLNRWYNICPHV